MQQPQLVLVRRQQSPQHVHFHPLCARLAPTADRQAAVSDDDGMLYFVNMRDTDFVTEGVYQLQYGTQLSYLGSEVVEQAYMVDRKWSSFSFVPGRRNALLFYQSGSNKLLYATLPNAIGDSSVVLHFGSHTDPINCFTVSQAGRYVVSSSVAGDLKLWSLAEGLQLDRVVPDHTGGCSALAFLEPSVVLSGGTQGGVAVWEINQQKLLARQYLDTGASCIGSLAGFQPSTVNQTDFLNSTRAMPWHQHRQVSSKADTVFVTAGDDSGALHVWAGTGKGQHTWQTVHLLQQVQGHSIRALSFNSDGSLLAVAAGTGVGHIWLYSTQDWSCHRLQGGLLRPPIACCFCEGTDLSQSPCLFISPSPSAAVQCMHVPVEELLKLGVIFGERGIICIQRAPIAFAVGGTHGNSAPAPPHLHYPNPADEEESCPQPSALPPSLAASLPSSRPVHSSNSNLMFGAQPPLPPHPLSKLSLQHKPSSSGCNSPTQGLTSPFKGLGGAALGPNSPEQGGVNHKADTDSGQEQSLHISTAESAGANLADALERAQIGTASAVAGLECHSHDQQQLQHARPPAEGLHAEPQRPAMPVQQQPAMAMHIQAQHQQPSELPAQTALDGRLQHEPNHERQDEDSEQEGSSSGDSECQSELAVGDDELLDAELEPQPDQQSLVEHPSTVQNVARTVPDDSHYLMHPGQTAEAKANTEVSAHHADGSPLLDQTPQQQQQQHMQLQLQQPRQQQRQPELQQQQSRLTLSAKQAVGYPMWHLPLPYVRTEEHTARDPSRLKAAYREANRSLDAMTAAGSSDPAACFEQPSLQSVLSVTPDVSAPSKIRVPQQLYVRPLASAKALVEQAVYPSRTLAGQCWAAGGQHPRSPLKHIQERELQNASSLVQPQSNSTALLAAKLQRLQGQEFDDEQVLQDADVQKRVIAAAAVAANVPCDAVLYHNLQPLDNSVVPTSAPKLVQKQLHPSWVAKQNLKPEMSDLWIAKERHRPVIAVGCLEPHVTFSSKQVAESLLRFH